MIFSLQWYYAVVLVLLPNTESNDVDYYTFDIKLGKNIANT